eukprot:2350212-Prymnesium_polylepis.1
MRLRVNLGLPDVAHLRHRWPDATAAARRPRDVTATTTAATAATAANISPSFARSSQPPPRGRTVCLHGDCFFRSRSRDSDHRTSGHTRGPRPAETPAHWRLFEPGARSLRASISA